MTLTALICMAVMAQAQTVYVSTGSDAVAYHKSKSCSYLKNSINENHQLGWWFKRAFWRCVLG